MPCRRLTCVKSLHNLRIATMPARRPRILLLNASLAGETGNTAVLFARARRLLVRRAKVESVTPAGS